MEKTRIRLNREHLAYVNQQLLMEGLRAKGMISPSVYIRDIIWDNFKIKISDKKDIDKLQYLVTELYYDDIGEFLQEKMREHIRERKE